ncbi:YhgE/Pip domain-containing protein [Natribacillus halophilus]|uniref:X-X-X-Leu-X-X-Gly heptad repeat-containing protein n=1 Tax=Natribacillus halophilus TaxID=549003 RepID=A0A1G8PEE1_9BACI|nr:YhgE/Pip domain-containing protein [Natribacillus halophilus]SDI90931.1 X-X-X-Leu-X-X-Gly heptad repeat-containing protein [Natribacillus halophilus]
MRALKFVMVGAFLMFAALPATTASSNEDSGEYSSKDETVYGNLETDGTLQGMYVVNTFHVTEAGEFVDHGDYVGIRNLTNLADMERAEDTVHFQAEEGEFYYQGEMDDEELPWDINVTYLLDGEEVAPDDLAGEDGSLEIQIATSANENVDPLFFENYMLQISLTLDPSIFADIQAPEGTKATEGQNQLITFTGMPEQEEEFIVSANVTDLEMDPIDISASPASMPLDDPDLGGMEEDMQSLSDAISEVNDGVSALNNGISDLNTGAEELNEGSSEYQAGIDELDQSSEELVAGSREIRDALQDVSESVQEGPDMPDVSELEALPQGIGELADGLHEAADGLDELKENYDEAYGQLDEAMTGIPDDDVSEEQIESLYESDADPEAVDQLVETYAAAREAKETYDAVNEAFTSVTGTLEQISGSTRETADNIETTTAEIESAMENMDELDELDALAELQEGISTMSSEYEAFHDGLVEYTDGVSELADSYEELDTGIQEFDEGMTAMEEGASELEDGTEELQEETSDLPGEMQSEVDEMMDEYDASDFEPASFVSDENEDVEIVQFVLETESIESEEPETTTDEEEEERGFWERFLDLFR